MQISAFLPLALAALALALPGVFKSDNLPDWVNGLIALAIVALFSYLTALTDGSLISGNFAANWAITAGIFGGLLAGPAAPLDQWLQSHFNVPGVKPAPFISNPAKIPVPLVLKGYQPVDTGQVSTPPQGGSGIIPASTVPPAVQNPTGQGDASKPGA